MGMTKMKTESIAMVIVAGLIIATVLGGIAFWVGILYLVLAVFADYGMGITASLVTIVIGSVASIAGCLVVAAIAASDK